MKMLRFPFLLLLCLGLLTYTGCGDDEDALQPEETLSYDGPNFTAPQLNANMFAAFFPADLVREFSGRQLEEVTFVLNGIPPTTKVLIYPEGADTRAPGDTPLYEQDITQRINASGNISHRLTTPLTLGNTGIWIAIETGINQGDFIQSVGCDQGLRYNPNGDRIRIGNNWTSFREVATETVNWNIKGIIAPQ